MKSRTQIFRAILGNGDTISVSVPEELCRAPNELEALLSSSEVTEVALMRFFRNCISLALPDIDPSGHIVEEPNLLAKDGSPSESVRTDLAVSLKNTKAVAAIDLRRPDYPPYAASSSFLDEYLVRSQSFRSKVLVIDGIAHDVERTFLVAGRAKDREVFDRIQQGEAPYAYTVITWDDIIARLRLSERDREEGTILLIHLIESTRRLLFEIARRPELLRIIDDRRFEELVATLLSDVGFSDVTVTPPRKDGGKDVIASYHPSDRTPSQTYLIECKHWTSGKKVSIGWALSLLDVVKSEKASAGVLITTASFSPVLLEQQASLERDHLLLRDHSHMCEWIKVWERTFGNPLFRPVDPTKLLDIVPRFGD